MVKVGYQYFIISGILFVMASIYLFWINPIIQALDNNIVSTKSISLLIGLWGIFRFYKGYKLYKEQHSAENEK